MRQRPYVENVVLDVTDLDTGVLCSWPVLEQRLKPEWNSKELWVYYMVFRDITPELTSSPG